MTGYKAFLIAFFIIIGSATSALAQTSELADRTAVRVCADPSNLPYSNKERQGFENKIADLIGRELGLPVIYTWFPQSIGFLRQTLHKRKCDLVMGYVKAHELVLNTNPYYRSSYMLIHRKGELDGLENLNDPRLKGLKIGVIAGTPPVTILAINDLLGNLRSFHRMVDRRYFSPAEQMIKEINSREIDVGILWGPNAGYFAKKTNGDLVLVPLVKETKGRRNVYAITFGVRHREKNWKRKLNRIIRKNQDEINKIMLEYGIPILDQENQLITQ